MSFQINISGGAYFEVQRPDGVIVYTLSRQFFIDAQGRIVTAEGYILLNQTVIPAPGDEPVEINQQGQVSVFLSGSWQFIGTIMVVLFMAPEFLQDLGNGYYAQTVNSGLPQVGTAGTGQFVNVKVYYLPGTSKKERPIAALDEPKAIANFIIKARMIVQDLTDNTGGYFTHVKPSLITVAADINALETAEETAKTHVAGAAAARDIKFDKVLIDMRGLQMYVQTLADNAPDIATAKAIINASGFDLKPHGIHTKDALKATHGKVSGTVQLAAKAVAKAGAYEWQMSNDNINWTSLPTTIETKTKVTALTPGSIVYFRCRAVKKTGVENWTQAVSIVVT